MNTLYPIFLKAEELNILVVGGKEVAEEKLLSLLSNSPGAGITVVAKTISKKTRAFSGSFSFVQLKEKAFSEDDLEGKQLVIAATRDRVLNKTVAEVARKRNILVNAADMPDLCDFYLSSVVKKGDLKIAFSTNGKSPILARRLREFFNDVIPDQVDDLIGNIYRIRKKLKGSFGEKVKIMNEITQGFESSEKVNHNSSQKSV